MYTTRFVVVSFNLCSDVTLQQQKQLDNEKAFHHYLKTLKKTCFHALSHYKDLQNQKYARKELSQEFWQKLQIRRVWRIWLNQCEHSEELKMYPLTRKARTFCRVNLLQKALLLWQNYRRWRKFRRMQYSIADSHYNKTILPRYLKGMEMFVDIMKEKREMQYEAVQFRREVLLSQGFYKWHGEYQLSIDIKMMTRMAILHHDNTIKQHYLKVWRQRTRQEMHEHNLEAKADYHYEQQMLIRAVTDWKNFTREITISRYYHQTAAQHYYLFILKKVWCAWSKYIEQREVKWRKQAIADIHYQHKTLRKCLDSWKVYHNYSQAAASAANQRFNGHQLARLRWALSAWHHFVCWHKNKCISNHLAKTAYRKTIIKKTFVSWHIYATQHALKVEEQVIMCQEKRAVLDKGKLHRTFLVWVQYTKSSLYKRSLHETSEQHHRKKLLSKTLSAWLEFVQLNFKIQLLHRQSQWLHNHRITTSFLRTWKHQYLLSVQTRRKTSLSLWHWSVTLQRKVFEAWLQYAITKKHKEIRIAQALDQRRTRLIKSGVTQWIKVAFHLSSLRNRYAQARHVQQAHNIHQFVYKCALHWRRWTAKRLTNREPQQDKPAQVKQILPSSTLRNTTKPLAKETTVKQILPDLFKVRPRPRVPDYLRDSYDTSAIRNDISPDVIFPTNGEKAPIFDDRSPIIDDKAPIKAPISSNRFNLLSQSDDTPCPRPAPPQPCGHVQPYPRQRSFTDDSMALSTDGEVGGAIGHSKHQPLNVKLLPPSSFQVPSKDSKDNDQKAQNTPVENIKTEIFEARRRLQEFYNLKLHYRAVKQRRDELFNTIKTGNTSTDEARQLKELDAELDELTATIEQDSATVEHVATNIQQLIEKVSKK